MLDFSLVFLFHFIFCFIFVSFFDSKKGWKNPSFCAVCEEHEQIVQILLEKGANVNSQEKVFFFFVGLVKLFFLFFFLSKGGFTPLYIAAENEYEQIVQILLEKGKPNVDLADQVLIC